MYKCGPGSVSVGCGILATTGFNGLVIVLVAVALIVAGLVLTRVAIHRIRSSAR